jgi:hypothetical protein
VPRIKFEERAVAFIDVLGFKSYVESASRDESENNLDLLDDLIEILEKVIPNLDVRLDKSVSDELIPKHISISDCIILSSPLTSDKMTSYCGLSILVMRVIQLTHTFLAKGYLIRGGISIGKVWHTKSNIVGPAYQEAYSIETKTGVPRVELSDKAKEYWLQKNDMTNSMCLEYRDRFMVNGLHDHYVQKHFNDSNEKIFSSYSDAIYKRVTEETNDSIQYKWWWFGEFLKNEMKRNVFIAHT